MFKNTRLAFTIFGILIMLNGITNFVQNKQIDDLQNANNVQHRLIYNESCKRALTCASPDQIHTARVYEDGSYVFEYRDGTSERGCYPNGLCQD